MSHNKPNSLCFQYVAPVELLLDVSSVGLTMVVPWTMPEDLQDDASESKAAVERIFKDEVGESSLYRPVTMDYRSVLLLFGH